MSKGYRFTWDILERDNCWEPYSWYLSCYLGRVQSYFVASFTLLWASSKDWVAWIFAELRFTFVSGIFFFFTHVLNCAWIMRRRGTDRIVVPDYGSSRSLWSFLVCAVEYSIWAQGNHANVRQTKTCMLCKIHKIFSNCRTMHHAYHALTIGTPLLSHSPTMNILQHSPTSPKWGSEINDFVGVKYCCSVSLVTAKYVFHRMYAYKKTHTYVGEIHVHEVLGKWLIGRFELKMNAFSHVGPSPGTQEWRSKDFYFTFFAGYVWQSPHTTGTSSFVTLLTW